MYKTIQNIIKSINKKSFKINIFSALFSSFLIFSCAKTKKEIVASSGNINSLSVIIDDQLWNGEIGDSIRNKFAAPIIGLPQEEPVFTINQYPIKLLEGFMNTSRNIIVVKKEPKSIFEINENEFAKPQTVVHISGNSVQEILDTIENNSLSIIEKIRSSEILMIQKNTKKILLNSSKIHKRFGIKIEIPKQYKVKIRRNKFVWIKKEITSGSCSILIYENPVFDIKNTKMALNKVLKIRDSIGSLYIQGSFANAIMTTENTYQSYPKKITINNKKAIETKGNWAMKNDNMTGPFVNYTIYDKARNRMLILEGFCYAPSKEKRDLMLELEAIIKSVQF